MLTSKAAQCLLLESIQNIIQNHYEKIADEIVEAIVNVELENQEKNVIIFNNILSLEMDEALWISKDRLIRSLKNISLK